MSGSTRGSSMFSDMNYTRILLLRFQLITQTCEDRQVLRSLSTGRVGV